MREIISEFWDYAVLAALFLIVVLLSGCAITISCPQDGCVFGGASASMGKPHPEQSPPGSPGQAVGVYRSEP